MGRLTLGTQTDQAKPISRRNREILALESSPLRSLSQETFSLIPIEKTKSGRALT